MVGNLLGKVSVDILDHLQRLFGNAPAEISGGYPQSFTALVEG
jgi:hypothetical protein